MTTYTVFIGAWDDGDPQMQLTKQAAMLSSQHGVTDEQLYSFTIQTAQDADLDGAYRRPSTLPDVRK